MNHPNPMNHRLVVAALSAALSSGSLLSGACLSGAVLCGTFASQAQASEAALAGNGYLGVQVNDAGEGVRILSVRDATPAADAGLEVDDIVVAIDGKEVKTSDEMIAALGARQAGDQLTLKLKRGNDSLEKSVTLRARPDDIAAPTVAKAAPAKKEAKADPPAEMKVQVASAPVAVTTQSTTAPAAPADASTAKVQVTANTIAVPAQESATDDAAPRKGGFLGVTLDAEKGDGTKILDVRPNGPAASAELQAGDKITAINGKAVSSGDAISEILTGTHPGESVEVSIERGGKKKLRTVKLAKYSDIAFEGGTMLAAPMAETQTAPPTPPLPPMATADNPGRGWLGVYLGEGEGGALVQSTVENGPAAKAGLKEGDKILAVGDKLVGSSSVLMQAMQGTKPGSEVDLVIERAGKKKHVAVKLGSVPTEQAVTMVEPTPVPEPSAEIRARVEQEVEKARAKAKQTAEKAKSAAEKSVKEKVAADGRAKERVAKAAQAQEEAVVKSSEAKERAKMAERMRTETVRKSAKNAVSAISGWFFPQDESAEIRVEKKDDGFWVTTGSGASGIMVPQDGETTLTLRGGAGGVQIVPDAAKAGSTAAGHGGMAIAKKASGENKEPRVVVKSSDGEDVHVFKLEDAPLVFETHGKGTHTIVTESGKDGTWVVRPQEGGEHSFAFKVDGEWAGDLDAKNHGDVMVLKSGEGRDVYSYVARPDDKGKAKKDVSEEKREVRVLPHVPAGNGGGIVINNNGGTVIIGDSIARDFLHGGAAGGHDILIDKTIGKEDKKEKLKKLGYEIEIQDAKKADKNKKAKKDDS